MRKSATDPSPPVPAPAPAPVPAPVPGLFATDGAYRLLIESITDYAIYILDARGIVSTWNSGAARLKGYSAAEIIGRHFSAFYTSEDQAAGMPALALREASTHGKFEREGWRVRKDGSRFWAFVVIDAIRNAAGELVGFAKITRDLTERRNADLALQASREQFRLLVQGVTDYAIYMLTLDGKISSWNAGAQRIKGFEASEVLGTDFSRFYTPEDAQRGEPQRMLETVRREGRAEKEGWRLRKDGSRFWAHVVIDPVRNDAGELIGFAKVTRDITQQRDARLALEQAREALFQSQKMDAIGQLTGGVAHDFNNLLTAIIGSLELLRKRLPDDAKMRLLLDNAVTGARRGAALTQRMLAFARRQDLAMEAIDLRQLVDGMSQLIDRSLPVDVRIERRFPSQLPKVLGDHNQLELAILNLVVNARDAMERGGRIVIAASEGHLSAGPDGLRAGDYVCLSVTDDGEGMDDATLARATEPFFTTKGIGKGTGLGLAMVLGVAQQCGGSMKLTSTKGVGTSVELWLPVTTVAVAPAQPTAVSPPSAPSLCVLAVDDDQLVLNNTIAMLEDLGHRTVAATSAAEALQILRSRSDIDLIITDHVMPQMSGEQLAEQVALTRPTLPVILTTGYAELSGPLKSSLTRLAKPFNQEDLARSLAYAYSRE